MTCSGMGGPPCGAISARIRAAPRGRPTPVARVWRRGDSRVSYGWPEYLGAQKVCEGFMREQVVKWRRAAAVAGAIVLAIAPLCGQSRSDGATAGQSPEGAPAAKSWKVPRLADGRPDLQGLWSYASALPLERPDPSAPNLSGNPDEARFDEVVGNYGQLWYEPGSRTDGRKWLLVDPPDGRIPPLTPEAGRKLRAVQEARRGLAREDPTPGG